MPTYYVADDVHSFRHDCKPVKASNPHEAAEKYCADLFNSGDFDTERPLECIVAEDEHGDGATEYRVKRTITIDDDAREVGPVEIPDDEDEAPADA